MPIKNTFKRLIKQNTKKDKTNTLRTWLFDKPAVFALLSFAITSIITIIYSIFASILNTNTTWPLAILLTLSFVWTICYLIKKLPHDNMYHDDFVAITNGCTFITILIPLVTLCFTGFNFHALGRKVIMMYMFHPTLLWTLVICGFVVYFYLLGLAISGIYAKYKRAIEIGINKWNVILSMPFSFLLMWTPGYLIEDKKHNSNMQIKTTWYSKFNKLIVSNYKNTLLMFIVLLLVNAFYNTSTLLWIAFLLAIYALWMVKYKNNFLKNINQGYSWTAIGINLAAVVVVLVSIFISK